MNNANMAGLNAMGGPVGGGMPPMNGGLPGTSRAMPANDTAQRQQLNTFIYDYFLHSEMFDCARALVNSQEPLNLEKDSDSRRDENGKLLGNGVSDEGMDPDTKDNIDSKRPDDLPAPAMSPECPESCFLYEWWCLFWDMFQAQRGSGERRNVHQYVMHTQVSRISSNTPRESPYLMYLIGTIAPETRAAAADAANNETGYGT